MWLSSKHWDITRSHWVGILKKKERKNTTPSMYKLSCQILSSFLFTGMRTWHWNLPLLRTVWPWVHDRMTETGAAWALWLCAAKIPTLHFLPENSLVDEKNESLNFSYSSQLLTHLDSTHRFKCMIWKLWNSDSSLMN